MENLHHRCSTVLQVFSYQLVVIVVTVNKLYNVVFQPFFLHPAAPHVFQGPGSLEFRFFRVQVQDLGPGFFKSSLLYLQLVLNPEVLLKRINHQLIIIIRFL